MNSQDQIIKAKDGREIQIIQDGDLEGLPVVLHHGTPGSRTLPSIAIADASEQGIRLIGFDRAGYGGSTPSPGRAVADIAGDVESIATALKIDRLAVWGGSGGGPHALACAALLPDLVAGAASLASPAPYLADGLDWSEGMGESNIVEFATAEKGRRELEEFIEAQTPGILSADPEIFLDFLRSLLSPVDKEALTSDIVIESIDNMIEGIKVKRDGWVDDDLAFVKSWGFDLEDIHIPVLLMHGKQDNFVPYSHGEWLVDQIPGVDSRILPDDGHVSLMVNQISEVHAWLKNKMA